MLYLRQLALPGGSAESNFFWSKEELKRTCYSNFYPFQIFPGKKLTTLTFEPVTIFCGGNGSGKTTLLNILADLAGAERTAPYNHSSFWKDYLALCQAAFHTRLGREGVHHHQRRRLRLSPQYPDAQ